MARNPSSAVEISQWRGLMTNADSHDIGSGAMVTQTNLACIAPGELRCRGGNVIGDYEEAAAAAAPSNYMMAIHYHRPEADLVVYQIDAGDVKAGRGFAI